MKTTQVIKASARRLGFILTLGAFAVFTDYLSGAAPAAESSKADSGGFAEHLKKWQAQMSDAFRDTFKSLGDAGGGSQLKGSVSADLREQNDTYTLRLSLPDRNLDKVEISFKESTLHVVAPKEGKLQRYEQSVVLGDVSPDAKPEINRDAEDKVIMITVPKTFTARVESDSRNSQAQSRDLSSKRDHDTMEQMWQMRHEMDRIFEDSFKSFSLLPDFKGVFDVSRFGSTYNIEEVGDIYVVRAYLPGRDMNNVKVTIEGQIMTIEAKAERSQRKAKDGKDEGTQMAQYTQLITLPRPVKSSGMKIDNEQGLLVITVPKA